MDAIDRQIEQTTLEACKSAGHYGGAALVSRLNDFNRIISWSKDPGSTLADSRAEEAFLAADEAAMGVFPKSEQELESLRRHLDEFCESLLLEIDDPVAKRDEIIGRSAKLCIESINRLRTNETDDVAMYQGRCIRLFLRASEFNSFHDRDRIANRLLAIALMVKGQGSEPLSKKMINKLRKVRELSFTDKHVDEELTSLPRVLRSIPVRLPVNEPAQVKRTPVVKRIAQAKEQLTPPKKVADATLTVLIGITIGTMMTALIGNSATIFAISVSLGITTTFLLQVLIQKIYLTDDQSVHSRPSSNSPLITDFMSEVNQNQN